MCKSRFSSVFNTNIKVLICHLYSAPQLKIEMLSPSFLPRCFTFAGIIKVKVLLRTQNLHSSAGLRQTIPLILEEPSLKTPLHQYRLLLHCSLPNTHIHPFCTGQCPQSHGASFPSSGGAQGEQQVHRAIQTTMKDARPVRRAQQRGCLW